jgi:hypothetical protein
MNPQTLTPQPKRFADLGIKTPELKSFIGDKIPMKKLIGKEITIHDYKTVPSKFEGIRLDLQITFNNEKRITWTSSTGLRETIEQIPKDMLPITTTVIEDNERFIFT